MVASAEEQWRAALGGVNNASLVAFCAEVSANGGFPDASRLPDFHSHSVIRNATDPTPAQG